MEFKTFMTGEKASSVKHFRPELYPQSNIKSLGLLHPSTGEVDTDRSLVFTISLACVGSSKSVRDSVSKTEVNYI